jgi:prolyl-tRNA synthetase
VVLGERGLAAGNAEYKGRRDEKPQDVPLGAVAGLLREKLKD